MVVNGDVVLICEEVVDQASGLSPAACFQYVDSVDESLCPVSPDVPLPPPAQACPGGAGRGPGKADTVVGEIGRILHRRMCFGNNMKCRFWPRSRTPS